MDIENIKVELEKTLAEIEKIKRSTKEKRVLESLEEIRENELENLRIIKGISDSSNEPSE